LAVYGIARQSGRTAPERLLHLPCPRWLTVFLFASRVASGESDARGASLRKERIVAEPPAPPSLAGLEDTACGFAARGEFPPPAQTMAATPDEPGATVGLAVEPPGRSLRFVVRVQCVPCIGAPRPTLAGARPGWPPRISTARPEVIGEDGHAGNSVEIPGLGEGVFPPRRCRRLRGCLLQGSARWPGRLRATGARQPAASIIGVSSRQACRATRWANEQHRPFRISPQTQYANVNLARGPHDAERLALVRVQLTDGGGWPASSNWSSFATAEGAVFAGPLHFRRTVPSLLMTTFMSTSARHILDVFEIGADFAVDHAPR